MFLSPIFPAKQERDQTALKMCLKNMIKSWAKILSVLENSPNEHLAAIFIKRCASAVPLLFAFLRLSREETSSNHPHKSLAGVLGGNVGTPSLTLKYAVTVRL